MSEIKKSHPQNASDALFERLAAEEPLLDRDDTSPSATAPCAAFRDDIWQQYIGSMMLLAAFIFSIAAGLVIFLDDDREQATITPAVNTFVSNKPALSPTLRPSISAPNRAGDNHDSRVESALLPTAAVDEAAIALLTPVPAATPSGPVIQRMNPPFTRRSGGTERQFVFYQVQTGDTLDDLAQRYNLSDKCTIVWSNDRRFVSPLRPGNQLVIPPVDGVFYKIREPMTIAQLAEQTAVDPYTIIESSYNPTLEGATPDSLLLEGMQIMIPGGNGGNCNIWVARPAAGSNTGTGGQSAFSNIAETISYYGLMNCNAQLGQGGFPTLTPLSGYQFWQGFSAYHTGVDLSANIGTPVMAAGAGTVIFAGWNNYGYGNTIVIAHASTFTLYGHLYDVSVNCGQSVASGQVIGTVGSTGNSSGPHLHFEIRNANFDPVDPCYTIRC